MKYHTLKNTNKNEKTNELLKTIDKGNKMETKLISISNYENSTLNIYEIPLEIAESETDIIEEYIFEELNFNLSNIEWFILDRIIYN
tara:strand:- start:302 stop:562 length:261 start_codon:yes stop_codon:yes gene_type:complete